MLQILKAERNDLSAILALQKLAYQSEAQLVHDFSIPPLTQTLEDITDDLNDGILLKAIEQDKPEQILGSVRGRFFQNTLSIGRLIVHPSFQNQGIGTALLTSIEAFYPHARYELFTSDKSQKNLSLYRKNGYQEFRREPPDEHHSYAVIFLEKYGRPSC